MSSCKHVLLVFIHVFIEKENSFRWKSSYTAWYHTRTIYSHCYCQQLLFHRPSAIRTIAHGTTFFNQKGLIFSYFSTKMYVSDTHQKCLRGTSNEYRYSQYMLWRNNKPINIFWSNKALELCCPCTKSLNTANHTGPSCSKRR